MKPITWLRKFAERGYADYPVATLAFYGPDNRNWDRRPFTSDSQKHISVWQKQIAE